MAMKNKTKNYFDYPAEKRRAIIEKAARDSNEEQKKTMKNNETDNATRLLRIKWWIGYHGPYQLHWWLIQKNYLKGVRTWLKIE